MLDDGPAELDRMDRGRRGRTGSPTSPASAVNDGIPTAYWEVRATSTRRSSTRCGSTATTASARRFEVFDPAEVTTPVTGHRSSAGFDTPTVDDHRGVEPYCSLTPDPCPLHDMTLTEALALGKPVVYMVGTPAHCQTGTCAPGLEFLVDEHERVGDAIAMVHADVYTDNAATDGGAGRRRAGRALRADDLLLHGRRHRSSIASTPSGTAANYANESTRCCCAQLNDVIS